MAHASDAGHRSALRLVVLHQCLFYVLPNCRRVCSDKVDELGLCEHVAGKARTLLELSNAKRQIGDVPLAVKFCFNAGHNTNVKIFCRLAIDEDQSPADAALARDTMWFTTSVGAYLGAIFAISPNTVAEVLSCERHAVCIRDKQWNLEPELRLRIW